MRIFFSALISFLLCIITTQCFAFQSAGEDSLSAIRSKIATASKNLRKKKPTQLKRIETADSSIIYGSDRSSTHIVLVQSHNRITDLFVQYQYDETGVFSIAVLKRAATGNAKSSNQKSLYYFEKGKLIYSKNRNAADEIKFLLSEADRYSKQGMIILKSIHANPVPRI